MSLLNPTTHPQGLMHASDQVAMKLTYNRCKVTLDQCSGTCGVGTHCASKLPQLSECHLHLPDATVYVNGSALIVNEHGT